MFRRRAFWPLVLLAAGCSQEAVELAPLAPRPVRYSSVESIGGSRVRVFSGSAVASVETRLSFRVGGTIERLTVDLGDYVRAGALIASLDPADYQLQVERAQASLAQADAQLKNYEADFRRVRGLYERDNASQDDYDAARAGVESARANLRAIQKQIEQARLQVSYCNLYAPMAGQVAVVDVEVNENVSSGRTIVMVNAAATPEVEIGIPELLIGEINRGAIVQKVTFTAMPDRQSSGVVTEIAPTSSEGMTTYPVRVRLTAGADGVRPGMAAEVEILVSSGIGQARLVVPPHSVAEDRQGRFVWVVEPIGQGEAVVSRRTVDTGSLVAAGQTSALEVVSGLDEGEFVVTAGVNVLEEGQRVRIRPEDRI
jgi:multidrug efflux system membrane fusion protein